MHVSQMRVRNAFAAVVMSALVVGTTGNAHAADRFVSTAGSDTANDCQTSGSPCRTVGYALTQAASGDTVKVAGGTYVENIGIDFPTSLALSGGWTADFAVRDPAVNPTVVEGCLQADAGLGETVVVTVEGFSFVVKGATGGAPTVGADTSGDGVLTLALANCAVQGKVRHGRRPGVGVSARSSGTGFTDLSLSDCLVEGHRVGVVGVSVETGTVQIAVTDSTIRRNAFEGGVSVISGDSATLSLALTDSAITRNGSRGFFPTPDRFAGGGLTAHVVDAGSMSIDLTGCTLSRNRTTAAGGGIYVFSGGSGPLDMTLTNSAVIANRAPAGGGIDLAGLGSSFAVELTNVTISANRARSGGGGVSVEPFTANTTIDLLNTILWGNLASTGADLRVGDSGSAAVNADHSDIGEVVMTSGTFNDLGGNINANPLLVNPGLNFHLTAGSPCIDTGTCTGAPTTDFEGDPRPTGASCDMGADEFVP